MKFRLTERLGVRVVAMLSVALLPLGLIALYQTRNVVSQADELARSALLGATLAAVEGQSDVIYEGFAAARVLGGAVVPQRDDGAACSDLMQGFTRAHPFYSYAAFIPVEGISTCNSRNQPADFRTSETALTMADSPRPRIEALQRGRVTGDAVLIIAQPVYEGNTYIGFVSLSMLHENLRLDANFEGVQHPIDVITLNQEGQVVLSSLPEAEAAKLLPTQRDPSSFLYRRATAFTAQDGDDQRRSYSLMPIVPGVVVVIAVWDPVRSENSWAFASRATLAFPVLMWLVSLVVAYVAVHRLVIRHIRKLRSKMRRFGNGEPGSAVFEEVESIRAPAELRQMEETFDRMAERITRDTAELENGLHEKNVLLKEVHHRVKNNLQLIASIMNMEIRKARSPETRRTLRRVQDRVLGLATVHSNLYHTSRLASLRADSLLDDVLKQTLRSALPNSEPIDVKLDFEPMILYPDQAVPLSLLATEAATNAVKYLGRPLDGSKPWIWVSLKEVSDGLFLFEIENSRGERLDPEDEVTDSTGLGNQLIQAFSMQLGSRPETEATDTSYRLSLEIALRGFTETEEEAPPPEPEDDDI
ncbi:sensor histidine kinase [Pseudooceanicola sp. 502str34]